MAIRAYKDIAKEISSSEANIGAYILRGYFKHTSQRVRRAAFDAYGSLVDKLDDTECIYVAAALSMMLSDRNKHKEYYWHIFDIYTKAALKLKGQDQIKALKKIRSSFVSYYQKLPNWTFYSHANPYRGIAPKLSPSLAYREIRWIVSRFREELTRSHPKTRSIPGFVRLPESFNAVESSFTPLFKRLRSVHKSEVIRDFHEVMWKFNKKLSQSLQSEYVYRLSKAFDVDTARQELVTLKAYLVSKNDAVRIFGARAIGPVGAKLSKPEIEKGIRTLEPLLKDPNLKVRVKVAKSIMKLALVHSDEERRKIIMHVKGLLRQNKFNFSMTGDLVDGYVEIATKMGLSELKVGQALLSELFRQRFDSTRRALYFGLKEIGKTIKKLEKRPAI